MSCNQSRPFHVFNLLLLHVHHPGDGQEPDEGHGGGVYQGPLPSPARWHDVYLVGIIGVEICHNVTRVNRIDVQIVVVVIVVVYVVVHVQNQREDTGRERCKVNSFGPAYNGGALGVSAGLNLRPLIDEGQISLDNLFLAISFLIIF